jgi:hypothetical protein
MITSIVDSCTFLNFGKLSKDEIQKLDRRQDPRNRFLVVNRVPGVCDVFECALFQRKSQNQSHREGYILIKIRGQRALKYDIASETVWIPWSGTRKAQIFDPGEATAEIQLLREASLRSVIEHKISWLSENLQNCVFRKIDEMIQFHCNSRFSAKEKLMLVRTHHLSQLSLSQLRELEEWLRCAVTAPQSASMAA